MAGVRLGRLRIRFVLVPLVALVGLVVPACGDSSEPSPDPFRADLIAALDHLREESFYSEETDWTALEASVKETFDVGGGSEGLSVALRDALRILGDRHGAVVAPGSQPDSGVGSTARVTGRMDGSVLVMDVPAFVAKTGSPEWLDYVTSGQLVLEEAAPCAVVVDLRTNGGGNVAAMVGAVAPLLGDGIYLRYVDRRGELVSSFGWQGGAMVSDSGQELPVRGSPLPDMSDLPVVFVTSRGTGSAAEGLLVAFLGRPDVTQIGEPTNGTPTGRAEIELQTGTTLLFAEAAAMDRDGTVYIGPLQPDIRASVTLPGAHTDAVEVVRARYGCR